MQSETVLSCGRSCSGRRRPPAECRARVSAGRGTPEGARQRSPLRGLSRCVPGCGPGGAAGNHAGSPEGAGFRLHQCRSLLAALYSVSSGSRWLGGQCSVHRGSQKAGSEPGESCIAAPGPTPFPGSHHRRVHLPSGSRGPAAQLPTAPCRGRVVLNIFIRPGTRASANLGALSTLRTWDEDFLGGLELKKKNTKFAKAIFFRMRREKPHQITNFKKLTNNYKQKWTCL